MKLLETTVLTTKPKTGQINLTGGYLFKTKMKLIKALLLQLIRK